MVEDIKEENINDNIGCERCSGDFPKDEIELYDGELLCDDCLDEVKDEIGSPHKYLN